VEEEHHRPPREAPLILESLKPRTGQPEEEKEGRPDAEEPEKLLGVLSRASDSLAEVVEALIAQRNALETRVAELQAESDGLRAHAEATSAQAAREVERLERAAAVSAAEGAREAARHRARAERAEHLLALVGDERRTTAFCLTVGRRARKRASREILREAVSHGIDIKLDAERGWRDSFLVAQIEGDATRLQEFLGWARKRFGNTDFRETQVS
jgi:hypothetical protein